VNGGSIPLCSLNVKTARWWRGIVGFKRLAREGRMTVTIGRRELLVALGGAAVPWLLTGRAQRGYNFNDNLRRRSKLVVFFDLEGVEA
jgi:hypothetical protein